MIKNIIFDLGNVLLEYKPLDYLKGSISDDFIVGELYNNLFKGREWIELDKGMISKEEAAASIAKRIPHLEAQVMFYMDNWHKILKPMEGTVELLKAIKQKGYKVYFLSNFHLHAFDRVNSDYDFFRLFDGGIVSSVVKLLKPEDEIYLALINKYSISPHECVFIDDMEGNVAAAEKLGFNGIQYLSHEDLNRKLNSLLEND